MSDSARYVGGYVSAAGGLYKAIERGGVLGVNTIMMHPSPPQRWCTKPFDPEQIKKFNDARQDSQIEKVHMHCIYLINLANPDQQKWHLSKMALVHYLQLAEEIDAEGVVFHTGSFKDTTEEQGLERVVKATDWILEKAGGSKPLLFEMAAGAGQVIGAKFEQLAEIRSQVKDTDRVRFCLDTQHMFASGYDLVGDLDNVILEADKHLGLSNIGCIHFNDSKTELGSKKDRHESLGQGLIGEQAMQAILNHPQLRHIDFVMETPAMKSEDTAKVEVQRLQSWAE